MKNQEAQLSAKRSVEGERHRRTRHGHPDGQWVVANLLGGETLSVSRDAGREREGNRHAARVAISGDGCAGDLVAGSRVGEARVAAITGLALGKGDSQVCLLESDHRPIDEADEFLHHGFNPRLEDGYPGRHTVDGDGCNTCKTMVSGG